MEFEEPSRRKRIALFLLQPKVALPSIFIISLILSPWVYRGYVLSQLPSFKHPFDIQEFGTVEITDEENAYVDYQSAVSSRVEYSKVSGDDFSKHWDDIIENGWKVADQSIVQWLDDNQSTLEIWQKGTAKQNAVYIQPKDLSFDSLLPLIQEMRTFARLARLQGLRFESKQNPEEAWDWYRAMYRCSRHSGLHGSLIERLVGMAIHAMAAEAMNNWAANPDVDAVLLRQAIEDVQNDYRMTAKASTSMKSEYLGLVNSLNHPDILGLLSVTPGIGSFESLGKLGIYFMGEPELCLGVASLYFENQLSQMDKPLNQRTPRHSGKFEIFELDAKAKADPRKMAPAKLEKLINNSILASLTLPAISSAERAFDRENAKHATLVMALAVQLYFREHGEFPEKGDQLVGIALDELPADPWGKSGEMIRYKIDEEGAVVWSVGLNGTDESGDLVDGNSESGDHGFRLKKPVR